MLPMQMNQSMGQGPTRQTPVTALTPVASGSSWQSMIPGGGLPNFNSFLGNTKKPKTPTYTDQYPATGGLKWPDMKKQLAYLMQGNVLEGLNFLNQMQPQYQGTVRHAMAGLNPANKQGTVEQYRRNAMGQAQDSINSHIGMLGGLDQNTINALRLGAMNSGIQAGNDFMSQQYDPEMDAKKAMLARQLMAPDDLISLYLNTIQEGQATKPKSSGIGGLINTAVGLAGAASGLGWKPFA